MKWKRSKAIPITCLKCRYSWLTRTTMFFVSCPKCGAKVQVVESGETGPTSTI